MAPAHPKDFAAENRERKADALVSYLLACLVENARKQTDDGWQQWFQFAGLKADQPPSEETKQAIISRLRRAERLFTASI